jgi:hypothetical protein
MATLIQKWLSKDFEEFTSQEACLQHETAVEMMKTVASSCEEERTKLASSVVYQFLIKAQKAGFQIIPPPTVGV